MTATHTYSPDVIKYMREWLSDCVWADMDAEDFADLSDAVIVRGVAKHYAGGVAEFLLSM